MTMNVADLTRASEAANATGIDTARLLVSCADRPGIVAAITAFLRDRAANIIQSDQYSTDPKAGSFFMRLAVHVPDLRNCLTQMSREFASEVADPLSMTFQLRDAAVPKRVAIMVSRYDHCLLDLLWRAGRGELKIDVGLVLSNWPDLADEVENFGVTYEHIPVSRDTKPESEQQQLALLRQGQFDLVVLARYMQVLSGGFLAQVRCPVINIHHSFLPAFGGAGPYERAKERGVKLIGATAHYVTEDLDEGPIIEQDIARVSHRDSAAELTRLGADIERTVLQRAVRWHCEDRVLVHGTTTVVF
jgi:formyltetrahydrofolate deformylase